MNRFLRFLVALPLLLVLACHHDPSPMADPNSGPIPPKAIRIYAQPGSWVALQDGDGAWKALPKNQAVHTVDISDAKGRYGVALIGDFAAQATCHLATRSEQPEIDFRWQPPTNRTVTATLTGAPSNDTGMFYATVGTVPGDLLNGSAVITTFDEGKCDLAIAHAGTQPWDLPDAVVFKRDIPASQGSVVVDWANRVPTVRASLTVSAPAGLIPMGGVSLITANRLSWWCSGRSYITGTTNGELAFALPSSGMLPTDAIRAEVFAQDGTYYVSRTAIITGSTPFRLPALHDPAPPVVISSTAPVALRFNDLRAAYTIPGDPSSAPAFRNRIYVETDDPNGPRYTVLVSGGWLDEKTTMELPALSALAPALKLPVTPLYIRQGLTGTAGTTTAFTERGFTVTP